MREIKLNKLLLRDFQNGNFFLDAKGQDVSIFGMEASGKTRLVSAFSWLIFNKDALGRSDFEIKNLDAQGEAAHNLEHTVEAEIEVDGHAMTLKKVFKEKWTRKRGSAEREFTGHATEYFVDGVPLQEKLYNQHMIDLTGDESRFRLLTSPTAFPTLHWQKQRQLLLEICGDVSDQDVIDSNLKLSPLTAILGRRSLEDHRKIVVARRAEINRELERIPVRIDEVRRGLPDVTGIDRKAEETNVQTLETALNDAKLKLQGIDTGGTIAEMSKKLQVLCADLRKMEEAHRSESLSTLNRLNQEMSEIGAHIGGLRRKIQAAENDIKFKEDQRTRAEKDRALMREKWMAVDSETFEDSIADTCPACGQSLPAERVQEARDKALAAFNSSKAKGLEEITEKGMTLKGLSERLQDEVETLKKERDILNETLTGQEERLRTVTSERDALKSNSEDFSGLPGRAELLDEIEDLEAQIRAERDGKTVDASKIKEEIATLEKQLRTARLKVQFFVGREQGERRIEELMGEEKGLAKEFEELENQLYLIEQFIKTKVSMLTERINSKFERVRFKLFNVLINGGIEDCCEITVNGVPFNGGLNNSARINAGLEIVKVLQAHFGIIAPCWLDNREGYPTIPDMPGQIISLYVSPDDKALRVETSQNKQKKIRQRKLSFGKEAVA